MAKTATILEKGLTVVSMQGPKNRTLDGVAGREQLVKFKMNLSDGYIWRQSKKVLHPIPGNAARILRKKYSSSRKP